MNKKSLYDQVLQGYINRHMEHAEKINYTDLDESDRLETAFYDELSTTNINGYPTASDMVAPDGTAYSMNEFVRLPDPRKKECRLRYYYLPKCHELYIGTTGSGKTTGCVEPQLRAISAQANKANLFITDPKGELFDRNAQHLKDNGYKLFILNFKALERSDNWNPLLEMYEKKMKIAEVGKNAVMRTGPVDPKLSYAAEKSMFGDCYIEYNGKAYPNGEIFELATASERSLIELQVSSLVNSLATTFIPVINEKDKSWEFGAQDLCKGILLCMLEDAANPNSGFTSDMMTIKTMHDYYLALRTQTQKAADARYNGCNNPKDRGYCLDEHPLLQNKSQLAVSNMRTALDNAPNTMRSYTGVFDGALTNWKNGHILSLTTGNSIDFDNLDDQPFAFFLITRDYDKSDNAIAGLAIDWVYRKMLERREAKKPTRVLHFLLDEFGNIPPILDFGNKIATARSRDIWFHLFIQSYEQLNASYGNNSAAIIYENTTAHIFLGTQSYETKHKFSTECGKSAIPAFASTISAENSAAITESAVVSITELDKIEPGSIYVKRNNMPVCLAQFIRSYVCTDFGIFKKDENCLDTCTPFSYRNFTDEKYTYKPLFKFI